MWAAAPFGRRPCGGNSAFIHAGQGLAVSAGGGSSIAMRSMDVADLIQKNSSKAAFWSFGDLMAGGASHAPFFIVQGAQFVHLCTSKMQL
jgi:hypothetical protein